MEKNDEKFLSYVVKYSLYNIGIWLENFFFYGTIAQGYNVLGKLWKFEKKFHTGSIENLKKKYTDFTPRDLPF